MPSILAEPRRKKQRLGADPQNFKWRYSENNFGAKLLGKMGWTEGKGIGKSEQGSAESIRVQANYSAKGFGYEISSDKLWVAHNDEFAQILAGLSKSATADEKNDNNADDSSEKKSTKKKELITERIRQRMKRKKFIRNLADCSEFDKTGIFGSVSASADDKMAKKPKKSKPEENGENVNERPSFGQLKANDSHIISTLSLSDYFMQKMQQKKKSAENAETLIVKELEHEQHVRQADAKDMKENEDKDDEEEARRIRKAEKRRKRQMLEETGEL